MKQKLMILALAGLPTLAWGQSAVDAYNLSQSDLRGTARFMGMGGAFTALGGDLSSITQNPAGLGVYRRSEIGVTLDISPRSITATTPTDRITERHTKAFCNNFGYVGVARLDGAMRTISWGVSYNRLASFDRRYSTYDGAAPSSLTNYIASYTNNSGVSPQTLALTDSYNPYAQSDADPLSILAYNAFLINDVNGQYRGLDQQGTVGDAMSTVQENGYVDEYAIDFGGNISDVVMWGVGVGITDLSLNSTTLYSESMSGAYIPSSRGYMTTGSAEYYLDNLRSVSGTGFNVKAGLIFRPINELRLGVAVHTPTWYSLSSSEYATVDADFLPDSGRDGFNVKNEYTDNLYYNFKLNAPWKFMIGAAGIIGNQAIVSLDYERQMYGDMKVRYQDRWGGYVDDPDVNGDIANYYKATDEVRLGLEYRVTPRFSVRAGYRYTTTSCKSDALDDRIEIYTAGTNPAYTLNKQANAISLGLGYRWRSIYLDGAYVWHKRDAVYKAFTPYDGVASPTAGLSQVTNDIVVSLGVRF